MGIIRNIMKECTKTDKPLVTIVMAIYNPDICWLKQQLDSLNNQNYENINLIACDDCSTSISYGVLNDIFCKHILSFEYKLISNTDNLGSTKTFEKLTLMADGDYISYCDQDDIWDHDKISKSIKDIEIKDSILSCSDVRVIDGEGKLTVDSITRKWKRHKYYEGINLTESLIFKNFVIGCTCVIRSDIARNACPFSEFMVHDQWMAIIASMIGNISVCNGQNMSYRIHGGNQTGTFANINSKKDYYQKRILPFYESISELNIRYDNKYIKKAKRWADARKAFYSGKALSFVQVLFFSGKGIKLSLFDITSKIIPDNFFKYLVNIFVK